MYCSFVLHLLRLCSVHYLLLTGLSLSLTSSTLSPQEVSLCHSRALHPLNAHSLPVSPPPTLGKHFILCLCGPNICGYTVKWDHITHVLYTSTLLWGFIHDLVCIRILMFWAGVLGEDFEAASHLVAQDVLDLRTCSSLILPSAGITGAGHHA